MAEEEAEEVTLPLGLQVVKGAEEQVAMLTPVRFMERQEPQTLVVVPAVVMVMELPVIQEEPVVPELSLLKNLRFLV